MSCNFCVGVHFDDIDSRKAKSMVPTAGNLTETSLWIEIDKWTTLTLYPQRGRHLTYTFETTTFVQNNLALRNRADVTGDNPMYAV
jgi:hypothetical protein